MNDPFGYMDSVNALQLLIHCLDDDFGCCDDCGWALLLVADVCNIYLVPVLPEPSLLNTEWIRDCAVLLPLLMMCSSLQQMSRFESEWKGQEF